MTFAMFKNAMITCRSWRQIRFLTMKIQTSLISFPLLLNTVILNLQRFQKNCTVCYQQLHPIFTSLTDQILTQEQFSKVQESLQNSHAEILKENKDSEANEEIGTVGMVSFPNIDNRKKDTRLKPAGSPPAKKPKKNYLKQCEHMFIS